MDKIVVATVYNSENCGSFLQAYAMQKTLANMGYKVGFYKRDTKGTSHDFFSRSSKVLKLFLRGHLKESYGIIHRWFVFEKLIKRFETCSKYDAFYKDSSFVLLGSDTIWNFSSEYFRSNASVFLGAEFSDKQVFSYAASVDNTSPELFCSVSKSIGGLNLRRYLVRDQLSKRCLEYSDIRNVSIVCDPSLLLGIEEYNELVSPIKVLSPFILLYYFGKVPEDIIKEIIAFAKKNHLKIVSLLYERPWCDVCTNVDPRDMISYYKRASYVFTNTFHGCAFAINFNIPFAAHDVGKNKVTELLSIYNCSERLFIHPSDIEGILSKAIDTTNDVTRERKNSISCLKKALS